MEQDSKHLAQQKKNQLYKKKDELNVQRPT